MSVELDFNAETSATSAEVSVTSERDSSVTSHSEANGDEMEEEENFWRDDDEQEHEEGSNDDESNSWSDDEDDGPGTDAMSDDEQEADNSDDDGWSDDDDGPSRDWSNDDDDQGSQSQGSALSDDDDRPSFESNLSGLLSFADDDDAESSSSSTAEWPRNDNGEYLVIEIDVRPGADIDLLTVLDVEADKNGGQLDLDTVAQQLAKVAQDTYIDVDFSWGRKPDVIVKIEEDFDVDDDVRVDIDFDPDDVNLTALYDIIQNADAYSNVDVLLDIDENDSDGDGDVVEVDVEVDIDAMIGQFLDAYIDAQTV